MLGLLGLTLGNWLRSNGPLGTDISDQVALASLFEDDIAPEFGPANADVTIIMFTDYQCPACRAAHPAMHSAVQRDGNTRIIYRDWPIFGEQSVLAARVAIAANAQGLYPQIHDDLMRERRTFTDPVLREIVQRNGGDWAADSHHPQ